MYILFLLYLYTLPIYSQDAVEDSEGQDAGEDSDGQNEAELTCGSYGQIVTFPVQVYECNGKTVTSADYSQLQDTQFCVILEAERKGCLCPADYFGRNCEKKRALLCNMNQVPLTCDEDPGKDYNTKIPGYAACIRFSENEIIKLDFISNCTVQNLGEYIDPYYLDGALETEEQILQKYTFTYTIDLPYAKSMEDYSGEGYLQIIDWNRFTDRSTTFNTILTSEEILGFKSWSVYIDTSQINKKYYVSGRIYYQNSNIYPRTKRLGQHCLLPSPFKLPRSYRPKRL